MASLNTLRTKYGIVLSVGIAVVLAAFILGDALRNQPGGNQEVKNETVLTINDAKVSQSEYAQYVQAVSESDLAMSYRAYGQELPADYVAAMAYDNILFDKFLTPAYEAAGLGFLPSDEETMFLEYVDSYIATNPSALTMSREEFETTVANNWAMIKMQQGDIDKITTSVKASSAYSAGKFTNRLEVNEALRNENLSFDGRYVMVPYSAITGDETVATEAEIEAYNKAHRVDNVNYGARTLSIVKFDIAASEEDMAAANAVVMEADAAVKAANGNVKDMKSALRGVDGKIGNYVAVSTLSEEEAAAIKAGENYGPVLNGNVWTAKYIVSKVNAPESITVSAIIAESNAAAETLVEDIKGVNGNLAELEAGANATTKTIMMTSLNERNADKVINAKVGDIFTFTIDNKPAAVVVTEVGKKDSFVLTANVNFEVKPSKETVDAINAQAETLMSQAGNDPAKFQEAVEQMGLLHNLEITSVNRGNNPAQVTPTISGMEGTRNIAIWAYDAKVGEKKNWTSNNVIYVAMITNVNNDKYQAANNVTAKREVEKTKKYNAVKETLTMDTTMEGAKSGEFAGVTFNSGSVDNIYDAAFVGAIARSTKVGEPVIVKGINGVYVFVVDNVNNNDAVVSADIEAKRKVMNEGLNATTSSNFMNYMMDGVKIVDKRGVGEL